MTLDRDSDIAPEYKLAGEQLREVLRCIQDRRRGVLRWVEHRLTSERPLPGGSLLQLFPKLDQLVTRISSETDPKQRQHYMDLVIKGDFAQEIDDFEASLKAVGGIACNAILDELCRERDRLIQALGLESEIENAGLI